MSKNGLTPKNDALARWIVGVMLILFSFGFVYSLILRLLFNLNPERWNEAIVAPGQINEAIIMLLAGGIGSSIYAIRAFIIHACDNEDFNRAYTPWYLFWCIQGALLGFIFYFVLKGGLVFLTIGEETQSTTVLNVWSLAGIGAIVGLFSKYAIEKLREIFIITFTSKKDLDSDEETNELVKAIKINALKLEKYNQEKDLINLQIRNLEKENQFLQQGNPPPEEQSAIS